LGSEDELIRKKINGFQGTDQVHIINVFGVVMKNRNNQFFNQVYLYLDVFDIFQQKIN
jgi:hypothetical protein